MRSNSITALVLLAAITQLGMGIIVNVKEERTSRCFRAEQSPDKVSEFLSRLYW